mmetsp:Transcript_69291/g.129404  ORF Transcript_69291/g.129404 Transcript_69291/m.129404 type:complete len:497 (+) Transcript_69291:129-1619(+)
MLDTPMKQDNFAFAAGMNDMVPGPCLRHTDPERFLEDMNLLENAGVHARPVDRLRSQLLRALGESAYNLPLPPGWSEHTQNSYVYFGHVLKDEASWQHPLQTVFQETADFVRGLINVGLEVAQAADAIKTHLADVQAAAADELEAWSGPYLDERSGEDFFYNAITAESVWESPAETLQYELYARYTLLIEFLNALHEHHEEGIDAVDLSPARVRASSGSTDGRFSASPDGRFSSGSPDTSPARRRGGREDAMEPTSSFTLGVTRMKSTASAVSLADSLSLLTSSLSPAVQPFAVGIANGLTAVGRVRTSGSSAKGLIKPPAPPGTSAGPKANKAGPPPLPQPPLSREARRSSRDLDEQCQLGLQPARTPPAPPQKAEGDASLGLSGKQPTAARRLELSIMDMDATPPQSPNRRPPAPAQQVLPQTTTVVAPSGRMNPAQPVPVKPTEVSKLKGQRSEPPKAQNVASLPGLAASKDTPASKDRPQSSLLPSAMCVVS